MDSERRERSRRGLLVVTVAAVVSAAFVAVLLLGNTRAAFVDTTDNATNTFSAGDVVLRDDDAGSVLFDIANLAPGDVRRRCLAVDYTGSLTADVRLYGTVGGNGLADYLDVDVEVGTGGGSSSCRGFVASSTLFSGTLAQFGAGHTGYADGLGGFSGATDPATRTYRITVALRDDNAAQGRSATAGFTWEAQSA